MAPAVCREALGLPHVSSAVAQLLVVRQHHTQMTIIAKNRRELYWSVVLFLLGLFIGHTIYDSPQQPVQLAISTGFRFAALLCLVNALADSRRLYSVERILAVPWLVVLIYYCATAVWQCVHYHPMYPYR